MGLSYGSKGLPIFAIIACVLAMTMSSSVSEAKTIVVGDSQGWRFGVNYTDWALQNSPFYINDKLVFKYEAPRSPAYAYSVYLLPNLRSLAECDFSEAKLLANSTEGSGDGFQVKLRQWRPYYFASYGHHGFQCNHGLMRLIAMPWPNLRR